MGLKLTPSTLITKSHIRWKRRKMAGYRDVLDSPISMNGAISQQFEHHNNYIQEMEDDIISSQCSIESATLAATSDDEESHRATKDAPGFVSSRGSIACLEELGDTTIPAVSLGDRVGGNTLHFRLGMGTHERNISQQIKVETEPTRETAQNDEIELISNCSSTSDTSLPPPGFCLPRKEIRDAIMYHEELGKALSTLALDPVMKCTDDHGEKKSAASTNSTAESTLDTTIDSSNSRWRLDALRIGSRRPMRENFTIGFDDRMEQDSCLESSSSKSEFSSGSSQRNRLEQHLSFLENHTMKQFPLTTFSEHDKRCGDNIIASVKKYSSSVTSEPSADAFFPRVDDLQSLPASASSCDVSRCISSPPNTPTANVLSDEQQSWFENAGNERIDDLRLIRVEMALMMSEYIEKTRSDISSTVDTQLEKHLSKLKSDVFNLSERLDSSAGALIQTERSHGNKENRISHLDKTPRTARSVNFMEGKGLPHDVERALSSMEKRIINSITSEIRANAMEQRHAIEEMVEEKISVALARSNHNIVSDIQQIVKQEIERASAMSMGVKASPPTASLGIGTMKKHTRGPQSPLLDDGESVGLRTRSITPANSIFCSISTNSEDLTQKSLEDSFSDTMKAIDQFVADCDEIASDFDRIALRMECNDVHKDPDCDAEEFEVLIGTANGFVMF